MLDNFFKRNPAKPLMSFKECYIEITGDRKVTGRVEDCDRTRMREAFGGASASRSSRRASRMSWAIRSRAA
jgi:hypothetical protein